ncbi:MAG: hypothetical protein ACRD1T_16570, partial [Acidimicrobiia bacterium]
ALFTPTSESEEQERQTTATQAQQTKNQPQPVSPITGASGRELAGRQLYEGWRTNSRASAEAVAREHVVGELFLIPYEGQPFKGCGNYQVVYNVCVIETSRDLLLLGTDQGSSRAGRQSFYVRFMLHVPLGSKVDYFPAAAPSPAG